MGIKDHCGDTQSNGVLSTANQISLERSFLLKEQFLTGDDCVPKVRKPYTITKQRERWTEEEHKKFLEALKLYGRAWRQIEEHVATKTAVQIRSHAQKFFSKVVRENSNDTTSVKPIEIPPPRPKRKPMHPYPRKMVLPPVTGTMTPEQAKSSESQDPSLPDQQIQSPTSVFSPMESETVGMTDSNSCNGSQSPVSSTTYLNPIELLFPEPNSAPGEKESSTPDEEVFVKIFGTTVLVTNPRKLSSHSMGSPGTVAARDFSLCIGEDIDIDTTAAPALCSLWPFYGHIPVKASSSPKWGSGNVEEENENSCISFEREENERKPLKFLLKLSSDNKVENKKKGFVPYKRCLADRDNISSIITGEEREEQRIRLCL